LIQGAREEKIMPPNKWKDPAEKQSEHPQRNRKKKKNRHSNHLKWTGPANFTINHQVGEQVGWETSSSDV